jgi:hypothetical protein
VEGIGGSVEIDSEPGRGTSCLLFLPRMAGGQPEPATRGITDHSRSSTAKSRV